MSLGFAESGRIRFGHAFRFLGLSFSAFEFGEGVEMFGMRAGIVESSNNERGFRVTGAPATVVEWLVQLSNLGPGTLEEQVCVGDEQPLLASSTRSQFNLTLHPLSLRVGYRHGAFVVL